MNLEDLRHRAHVLQDLLSSTREIGAQAKVAGSPTLLYLTELLIRRSFDELDEVQRRLEHSEIGRRPDEGLPIQTGPL